MTVEQRVAELGLEFLPEPLLPNGVRVQSARAAMLAILGSLRRTLGSLDRIRDWVRLSSS